MRISTLIATVTRPAAGALALLAAPCALALSLGDAAPQSWLGQPLRVVVPIGAAAGQPLTAACVHVIADATGGSGPPRLLTGRVTIDRSASGLQLLVTTIRPVNDPVVRLAVQAGCDGTTRRDYVLLLDPPAAAGPVVAVAHHSTDTKPIALVAPTRDTNSTATAVTYVATAASDAAPRVLTPKMAAAEAPHQPILLSSPSGSSFIPEASAAGLPRAASAHTGLTPADVEPPVAPWWPLAAALLVVAALARWLVPMRRRSAMEPPAWVAPTARTEPNPSVSGRSTSRFGKTGHFAAMTEPGPGFPRGGSAAEPESVAAKSKAAAAKPASTVEDPRFADFDADLVEEQTIRAEWAKAMNDSATDIGGDSILKAIDDAERAIHGAPAHPAQVALDCSLDDELLPNKARR